MDYENRSFNISKAAFPEPRVANLDKNLIFFKRAVRDDQRGGGGWRIQWSIFPIEWVLALFFVVLFIRKAVPWILRNIWWVLRSLLELNTSMVDWIMSFEGEEQQADKEEEKEDED